MMIDIFGRIQYVHELKEDIDIAGRRLYVLLKQKVQDGKIYYEYMGSMLSTLEDNSIDFLRAFLPIATHYALPADETVSDEALQLKEELDKNDRSLIFKGIEAV
ncbi:MAG: hypothetical protein JWQ40_3032 [Segetibacter sp.]|nr:hypothetical protein [Segetibacter sp.]